mgnify:FL=1
MLLGATSLWARPGYSKPVDVLQPDGTTVTLLMHGDEFLSFMTTTDGYTVVKGSDGFYRYAEKQDDTLTATNMIARNPEVRNASEQAFLLRTKKYQHAELSEASLAAKERADQLYAHNYTTDESNKRRVTGIWDRIDYSKFKGLVILVEWNDRKFGVANPQTFYQRMTNEKNLVDESKEYYPVPVTGSVKDYFVDNSMGIFEPTFDVVGPVAINYSCTYPAPKNQYGVVDDNWGYRITNIIKAVMNQVNNTVDFNDYDLNNDGIIDMVFFVFAGYGSYVQGNDYRYMWPHAEDFSSWSARQGMTYDGKRFGRYACSMEIQDYEAMASQHVWLDGIGTMCHEFSHVLGLADHYDTDYETNGVAPPAGLYDVMDNGADFNYGLTPVGYSAFERHILGFTEPTVLDTPGNYELASFHTGNKAFIVNTKKTNEDFYVENRQKERWDTFLPSSGLLIWRADTSRPSIWKSNDVNISPDAMNLELLGNAPISSLDITSINNSTWANKGAAIDLYSIRQQDNGNVTFEAGKNLYPGIVEDFESTPLTDADATGLSGKFCSWDLSNATVENTTAYFGNGKQMVKIARSGTLTTSTLEKGLRSLEFTAQNDAYKVRFTIKIQEEGSDGWKNLAATKEIAKNKSQSFIFYDIPAGSKLQFQMQSTYPAAALYLDDITVTLPNEDTSVSSITVQTKADKALYNLSGQKVSKGYRGLVISDGKKMLNK